MQALRKETLKTIARLSPGQQKRLKQLWLQFDGPLGLITNTDVTKQLRITDEQKEKLKTIRGEMMAQLRLAPQANDREKKQTELRKAHNEKAMGLLTADQKSKWKELLGESFAGEFPPNGFSMNSFTKGPR